MRPCFDRLTTSGGGQPAMSRGGMGPESINPMGQTPLLIPGPLGFWAPAPYQVRGDVLSQERRSIRLRWCPPTNWVRVSDGKGLESVSGEGGEHWRCALARYQMPLAWRNLWMAAAISMSVSSLSRRSKAHSRPGCSVSQRERRWLRRPAPGSWLPKPPTTAFHTG